MSSVQVLKTLGKGEMAHNKQFLFFPTVISTHLDRDLPFSTNLKLLSANSFGLEESEICHEKGLKG